MIRDGGGVGLFLARQRRGDVFLHGGVEEGVHAEVFALGDGVVLVGVALCAGHGEPMKTAPGVGAVDGLFDAILFGSMPPSRLVSVLRWKPVAARCARVGPGRRS